MLSRVKCAPWETKRRQVLCPEMLQWRFKQVCVTFVTTVCRRYALLGGAAFTQGLVVGPLIDAVMYINPALVLTAFLATAAVFACFSLASMLSKRRSYLYLGGEAWIWGWQHLCSYCDVSSIVRQCVCNFYCQESMHTSGLFRRARAFLYSQMLPLVEASLRFECS